jgi:hypothetical protein
MSEKPHCVRARNGCKMQKKKDDGSRLINVFNEFLRISVINFRESIGEGRGSREIGRPRETARKVQQKVAGCTIGGWRCIQ